MTVILGGGISGLSAAYYALETLKPKAGVVSLLEKSNRLGGWIRSKRTPSGAVFEKGPRTIRPRGTPGKNTLELIEKLQLDSKVIPVKSNHPAARNRLIYFNDRLHLLPSSLGGLFAKSELFERPLVYSVLNELRVTKREEKQDESIYGFVERRLGKDIAENLISPMICGICAGNAKQISVNFLARALFEAEQKYGSFSRGMLLNGVRNLLTTPKTSQSSSSSPSKLATRAETEKWSVWGLQGGLEELPKRIEAELRGHKDVDIRLNDECKRIVFHKDRVEVIDASGKASGCSRVISSLSAKTLSGLIAEQHPQLANELKEIRTVTVAVVNLEYSGKNSLPMEAFGFLVPPNQKLPILGVIFDSCVFPRSTKVLTVMMGGSWFEHYFGTNPSEEHLLKVAEDHVKRILSISEAPIFHDVEVLENCIPQHVVGHSARMQRIRSYISSHNLPLSLCGSSYDGVGLNDVILSAKEAVLDIQKHSK